MKTIPHIPRSLLAASLAAVITTHASGDPFVGSFSPMFENHDNIKHLERDGLDPLRKFSLKVSKSGGSSYTAKLSSGSNSATIPTKRIGNRLVNSPSPTDMGGWTVPDFIILSDGTNRAFVMLGEDAPDDISCAIGIWSDHKGKVTVDDFVGTWKFDTYGDPNLLSRNGKDGFRHEVRTAEVMKLDSTHIEVMTSGGTPLALRVSGNQAALESPPVNIGGGRHHTFRMRTDGRGMVFAVVATELDDPTDVSATIGLGVKQGPEISIQQPAGTPLVDGKAKSSFGTRQVGGSGRTKVYTIKNDGNKPLKGLAITKDGAHSGDFGVSPPRAATLAPGKSTTFKVTFKPAAPGTRSAVIHIKSNDKNENPFDIQLSGMGVK